MACGLHALQTPIAQKIGIPERLADVTFGEAREIVT
jgi:hypothetical protein